MIAEKPTRHSAHAPVTKPLALIILDGFGIRKATFGNAIAAAKMPFYRSLLRQWPHATLQASGEAVGLPKGFQGNSEVGHLTIGAGRVVYQMMQRINHTIADKSFFRNAQFLKAILHCKRKKSTLHLMGLVQDQGVHSHQDHLFALLRLCAQHGLHDVAVHFFSDGRDTPPKSALKFLVKLQTQMRKIGVGRIVTVSGRYYAMDRDQRWQRTAKAYSAIAFGNGSRVSDARGAILRSYRRGVTDEFILPTVIGQYCGMSADDALIFFNFRLDRARQLSHAFADRTFGKFRRMRRSPLFIPMSQYYAGLRNPAFPEIKLTNLLGEVLAKHGIRQLRIAETEKYAHVTYFFNGQREKPFPKEDRVLIPSNRSVPTYDKSPPMSATPITNRAVYEALHGTYDVLVVNYANPDMVGHTGVLPATVKALKTVDHCLAEIIPTVLSQGGVVCLTADHGNCEEKIDPKTKGPLTAHTTNPVPFILIGSTGKLRKSGTLADVAPTILSLLGIRKPKEMTGKSLIRY